MSYRQVSDSNELFVVAYVNDSGEVTGFPMGGGSSTKPSIKAHEKLSSAKRSSKYFSGSKVVKVTSFEIVT